jgi:SAM-dependent methyltransferase
MSSKEWEALAEWWDDRFGDDGDLWHRTLIDPALLSLIGKVAGLHVLDLACGNGYLSRRFARQGARVTAIDASRPMLDRARAREEDSPLGIEYHLADAGNLTMVADGEIDLVVASMSLMDFEDGEAAIGEIGRVLHSGGRLVASILHPCFEAPGAAWLIERVNWEVSTARKIPRYREPGRIEVPWHIHTDPTRVTYTYSYHRPLSWYVKTLSAAGMALTAVEEPSPQPEMFEHSSQAPYIAVIPLHLVFEALKLP